MKCRPIELTAADVSVSNEKHAVNLDLTFRTRLQILPLMHARWGHYSLFASHAFFLDAIVANMVRRDRLFDTLVTMQEKGLVMNGCCRCVSTMQVFVLEVGCTFDLC